jgi:hypothetical protein
MHSNVDRWQGCGRVFLGRPMEALCIGRDLWIDVIRPDGDTFAEKEVYQTRREVIVAIAEGTSDKKAIAALKEVIKEMRASQRRQAKTTG